jgi:hypothetical protein
LTRAVGTTMSTRAAAAPPSRTLATMARWAASTTATTVRWRSGLVRQQRAASEIRLAAGGFDHGGHNAVAVGSRASCGSSGRPRRSDWRWAALTTAAMARRRSGLSWWRRAASEIRLAAGYFDHVGHDLHHGGMTSMVAGPDLGPTRLDMSAAIFFILENWSFVSARNS